MLANNTDALLNIPEGLGTRFLFAFSQLFQLYDHKT